MKPMKGLVVFDLEGVLVEGELLVEIARLAGINHINRLTEAGLRGELPWEKSFNERMKLLKGVHREVVKKAGESLKVNEEAENVVRELKRMGFKVYVVSGGFEGTASAVKERLGLDGYVVNRMVFRDQSLDGWELKVRDKGRIVRELKEKLSPPVTITVGDGANDIPMFKEGIGVAYRAKGTAREHAKFSIDRLEELLKIAASFTRAPGPAHKP